MKSSPETKAICTAIVALSVTIGASDAQILPFKHKDFGLTVTPDARQLADQGNAFAQAVVAMHYQIGWDTEKNPELAVKYAAASANARNPLGLFRLGALLRSGTGVPKDEQKGLALQAAAFDGLYSAQDPYSMTAAAIMIFQGKVVGQSVGKKQRQKDAADLYKRAADMGFAPAQFNYAMVLKDGNGVRKNAELSKEYLEKAVAQSYPFAQEFALEQERKLRGVDSGAEGSFVEGLNMAGQRWAYEFLDHTAHPTQNLSADSAGLIVFADDRYVVRAAQLQGSVDVGALTSKTELSFYDVRSGKLKALVSVPNSVFKVGSTRFAGREVFYIGTITPGKYQFVDYPMTLVLVDIETRKLERLPLVESDYWLALNNPVEIAASESTITVKVDPEAKSEMGGEYLSMQPATDAFAGVNVVLSRQATAQSGQEHLADGLKEHKALIESDASGLSYLGDAAILAKDPLVSRGEFVVSTQNSSPEMPRMLRAESSGAVTLFDFTNLVAETHHTDRGRVLFPRFFDDGTIAWISGAQLHFVHNGESGKTDLPKVDGALLNQLAVPSDLFERSDYYRRLSEMEVANSEGFHTAQLTFSEQEVGVRVKEADFFIAHTPFQDGFGRFDLSRRVKDFLVKAKNADVASAKESPNPEWIKKAEDRDVYSYIVDWDLGTKTFVANAGVMDNQRIESSEGMPVGPPMSNHRGYYAGVSYSNESNGWRAYSYCNDSHSGGASSCVMLERINADRDEVLAFRELSDNADPLALNVVAGKALLLYGAGDSVCLAEVDLASARGWEVAKSSTLKQWKFASRFGKALCDHETGMLFVPNASGFEVWSIWQEKPAKRFDLVLGEGDQYAVLLPNGSYAGSPGCESLLRLKAGDGSVDGSSIASWRNRPAEVLKALGGDPEQIEILDKVTERWHKRIGFDASKPEPKASDLPKVAVPERPALWAESDEVQFPVEWQAGVSPVCKIIVRVNGVESAHFQGDGLPDAQASKGSVEAKVKLAEGHNWIEVTAEDAEGRRSDLQRFRSILKDSPAETKRYIVALGVSDYAKPELNLQFAAKDAKDLLEALAGKGAADTGLLTKMFGQSGDSEGSDHVLLLTNDQVDQSAVEKIREFVGKSAQSDEVILFCAGHGVLDDKLDYYFAGHDFDPDRPAETGIKLDDLVGAVSSAKALKRLVLLDTCHAGVVGEKDEMLLAQMDIKLPSGVRAVAQRGMKVQQAADFSASDKQRFIEEMFSLPGTIRGVNIIGASAGAQFALESDQWNNGVFTASVIEGLHDKKADWNQDGRIMVSELKNYLGQRVSELTAGAQKPSVVAFEQDQDFDLLN
jgi:hypothetical protein